MEYPAHGQVRVSNELRKQGVFVSPSGVRSIWLRHTLQSRKLRLKALEARVAKEGIVLTEAQVVALERQKSSDEAHDEIETEHTGYLGSQDTYYVGTIKGIGRIYQQTFVDTYSKVAACKLYTTKTPIMAADLLNDPACCRCSRPTASICSVSSPIAVRSSVAGQSVTTTSCTWQSTPSNIRGPGPTARKPTASASASTER